ncbi:hypothetical protein FXF51_02185 [Nonomuraea sp. PA05]|uniref:hypothetical protein n=1 Tax=Nonomuraea sp. PA05 TaxID=2604466 RepID=UPI0011DA49A3|nr:hypothetical protein [Nonomuraea sp. PA05]TYB71265.1 hypothetical protein FXF51_02185 [Nonomuraea sp. PA05]
MTFWRKFSHKDRLANLLLEVQVRATLERQTLVGMKPQVTACGDYAVRKLLAELEGNRSCLIMMGNIVVIKTDDTTAVQELTPPEVAFAQTISSMEPTRFLAELESFRVGVKPQILHSSTVDGSDTASRTPPVSARRLAKMASSIAVEPERDEEWRNALQDLAATGTQREVICFAAGLLYAALHSRATHLARRAGAPCVAYLCWVLRSQIRTWAPLLGLSFWGGLETAVDTGPGAGIVFILVTGIAFFGLVEWLRKRLGVRVGRPDIPLE